MYSIRCEVIFCPKHNLLKRVGIRLHSQTSYKFRPYRFDTVDRPRHTGVVKVKYCKR